jgi:ABC-type Fe3+-citrate transport system substrate-binding protein
MNIKKKYSKGGLYSLLADGGKPDYLDLDKDGDKKELMRDASKNMAQGGKVYKYGGVNSDPKSDKIKLLKQQLSAAKTSRYATEEDRLKDIAMIERKIRDLGK